MEYNIVGRGNYFVLQCKCGTSAPTIVGRVTTLDAAKELMWCLYQGDKHDRIRLFNGDAMPSYIIMRGEIVDSVGEFNR